jgi:hypothetical protein
MEQVPGTPAEKLAWLHAQKSSGKLGADDPDEVAQAEALLTMLARLSGSRKSKEERHLDELLDEGLKETFPASDPVSVGHFCSNEAPSRPVDSAVLDLSAEAKAKGRPKARRRRYG